VGCNGLNKNIIYLVVCSFIVGLLIGSFNDDIRYPLSEDSISVNSPSDRILESDLHVFSDRVVIEKENLIWAKIKNTHSMEPVLNSDSISLELAPNSPGEINIGDIISFEENSKVLIHRVVLIGVDELGWFAATKGDNNEAADPYKIRFDQIKGVLVGVLY